MSRFLAVTRNTFLQTLRQPIYGLIVLATLGSLALAPSITGWTLDDDNKLLRDLGLSTLLIQGLFLAAFSAAGVISKEIEDKTVLTVAAKPVGRATFIAGKYCGVLLALCVAHYMAMLALTLTLRHGVLQTSAESSDVTVLIAGPGVMLLVMIIAGVLNYVFDWKFLSTTIVMGLLALSLSTFVLLFVDRHGNFRTYEVTQEVLGLPKNIDAKKDFKGIITYRDTTPPGSKQETGLLVRDEWLGPISDADRGYLLRLSNAENYVKNLNFLVQETRKLVTPQMLKASVALIGVLAIMASFAIAVSTRLSTPWTLMLTLLLVALGMSSDSLIGPHSDVQAAGGWAATLASIAYHIVPNIQFFWLIDAVSEDRVIPAAYLLNCFAYAAVFSLGVLALGASLFETREVG
jgi:ABC-type transport system involved in multi-copper enzyme maturation permease subunit